MKKYTAKSECHFTPRLFSRHMLPPSASTAGGRQLVLRLQLPSASQPPLPDMRPSLKSQVRHMKLSSNSVTTKGKTPQTQANRPKARSAWSLMRQPSSGQGVALGGSPAAQRRMFLKTSSMLSTRKFWLVHSPHRAKFPSGEKTRQSEIIGSQYGAWPRLVATT